MSSSTSSPKKVLLCGFTAVPGPSGLACWLEEQIRLLGSRYDLDVLTLKTEDLSHIERLHGARLLRVPVSDDSILSAIQTYQRALARQLESEDYLLCHYHSVWEGVVLASHKKRSGYKLVYEVGGLPSLEFKAVYPKECAQLEKSRPLAQMEQYCLEEADAVLAGSEQLRQAIIARGLPPRRVELVYPLVNTGSFDVTETARHPGTILYLGSLAPWQGLGTLLRAMEMMVGSPVKLNIICPHGDPARREVLGKVQMMGLGRRVELLDEVSAEKLPVVVKRSDVCVAPLGNHPRNGSAAAFPHKVLVYLASRRPLVAARQPVLQEILSEGVHALFFTPGDAAELAGKLKQVLFDRELAEGLANRARLLMDEKLRLESSTGKIRGLYRRLLAFAEDTDRLQVAPADTDTVPGISPQGGVQEDTQPREKLLAVTEDTVELPFKVAGGEQPPATREDIVFQRVEDEDTAPRNVPDEWQVAPLQTVRFPEQPAEEQKSPGRWLLGGPSYPVGAEVGAGEQEQPVLLSDSDVVLIDGETPATVQAPAPEGGAEPGGGEPEESD